MKRLSGWLLALIFIFHFVYRASAYLPQYTTPFNPDYWEQRYLKSQWVMEVPEEPIGDDGVYAHAGWEYLHGRDPSTIVPEVPPLGKYLLGLTTLIFGNQNLFGLFSGIAVLVVFYQLNRLIFKDRFWALLPVVLFSFEPLFWQQLRAPYLDLLYLFFLLLTFYFFLQRRYWLSTFFWACFINTKAPHASLFLLALVFLLFFIIKKDKPGLKRWLFSLPILVLVTLLVYFRYFQIGHDLRDFLGFQKWVLAFYRQGARGSLSAIWLMLLSGRWLPWWQAEVVAVEEWQLSWPFLLITFLVSWFFSLKIVKNDHLLLIALWLVIYFAFLHFVPLWPRYLLIWLPFGYNLLVWQIYGWKRKKS